MAYPKDKNQFFNPYNQLLYRALESRGNTVSELSFTRALFGDYNIFHIHWPESFVARQSVLGTILHGTTLLALCLWLRFRGMAIVWTAHNLQAHDSPHPGLERIFMRLFLRNVAHILHLSKASRRALIARYPRTAEIPATVTPHGHYLDAYPRIGGRPEALEEFGIAEGSRVAVFVGLIRRYKNVPALIRAFSAVPDPRARLIIAGRCDDKKLLEQIITLASKENRILLRVGFVRNEDIWKYFLAATVTVLPYSEILNSGASFLALSFGCPLLTPNMGSLREMSEAVGTDYHQTYDGELAVSQIEKCFERFENIRVPLQALKPFDWETIARDTLEGYRIAIVSSHK